MRFKRICLITNRYPLTPNSYASPFVRDFAQELKNLGYDVFVFTPNYYGDKVVDVDITVKWFNWLGGEKVVSFLKLYHPYDCLKLFSFLWQGRNQLINFVKENKIEYCFALWAIPSGWFAKCIKKLYGIPYSVWTLGGDVLVWAKKPIFKHFIINVLKEAEYLFSNGGCDLVKKTSNLSGGRKCHFLSTSRKLPKENGLNIQVDKEYFNFLFIGRCDFQKGIDVLIKAMHILLGKIDKVRLYVLGDGRLLKGLKDKVHQMNMEENIFFKGYVGGEVIAAYLSKCNCLVIPSRKGGDSIPVVLSEAIQFKIPVIGTEIGDLDWMIKKYNLGKIALPDNPESLAKIMMEFILEKKDYTTDREKALELFNMRKRAEDFITIVSGQ